MTINRRELLLSGGLGLSLNMLANAASPARAALRDQRWQALDQIVDTALAQQQTVGMALAVWQNGALCYQREAGWANLESASPVQAQSCFRIGSLSKQFSAALAVKLASAGQLDLDRPVADYLSFLPTTASFSLRELMQHTAGIRDSEGDGCGLAGANAVTIAQQIAAQNPLFEFAPGSAWHYSNANYQILGAVLEQLSGKSLARLAQELLFTPAGLQHTAFDHSQEIVVGRVAGYTPNAEAPGQPFTHAEYLAVELAGAAGAMRSTSTDLCRWHQALMAGKILSSEEWASMLSPGRLRDGELARSRRFDSADERMGQTDYGFGLLLDTQSARDHGLIISHHGGINGFCAFLASHVPSRLTYAVLFNVDTHPGLPLREIRRAVFAQRLA